MNEICKCGVWKIYYFGGLVGHVMFDKMTDEIRISININRRFPEQRITHFNYFKLFIYRYKYTILVILKKNYQQSTRFLLALRKATTVK